MKNRILRLRCFKIALVVLSFFSVASIATSTVDQQLTPLMKGTSKAPNGASKANAAFAVKSHPVVNWSTKPSSVDSRTGVRFLDIQPGCYVLSTHYKGKYGIVAYYSKSNNPRKIFGEYFAITVPNKNEYPEIRDAQLSPDKAHVLFKIGFASEEGLYSLCILDLSKNTVDRIPYSNLASPNVSWSPDGGRISFIAGGSKNDGIYENYPPNSYIGPRELIVYSLKERNSVIVTSNDTVRSVRWINSRMISYNSLTGPDPYYPTTRPKYDAQVKKGVIEKLSVHFFDVLTKKDRRVLSNAVDPSPSPSGEYVLSFLQKENQSNLPLEKDWLDRLNHYDLGLVDSASGNILSFSNMKWNDHFFVSWSADEKSALSFSLSPSLSTSKLVIDRITIPELNSSTIYSTTFKNLNVGEDEDAIGPTLVYRGVFSKHLVFSLFQPVSLNLDLNEYNAFSSVHAVDVEKSISFKLLETREHTLIDYKP